ncbi:hypothetical protein H257_19324 [Aphanomyces astaci]|uniref:Uncharacterized protein n=1 Tax=Aphanomyces astaci TaxID=112090 RepID=W4F9Z9_APHAT|nr:hypothetical protein H257_19324 [Aphanomyces astaci]ETV63744.1 hypothetical protein H257_19324 [Aphanomyces astaci]|eukprot:XP_009846771.1 hypothetical protein H257_19324 [Aphanomyces astaci]
MGTRWGDNGYAYLQGGMGTECMCNLAEGMSWLVKPRASVSGARLNQTKCQTLVLNGHLDPADTDGGGLLNIVPSGQPVKYLGLMFGHRLPSDYQLNLVNERWSCPASNIGVAVLAHCKDSMLNRQHILFQRSTSTSLNILDAGSRFCRMFDEVMRSLEQDHLEWVLHQEGEMVVEIMTKLIKPESLKTAGQNQLSCSGTRR